MIIMIKTGTENMANACKKKRLSQLDLLEKLPLGGKVRVSRLKKVKG